MDRHDFIRMEMILEEMEESNEKKSTESSTASTNEPKHEQGGWPAGVHLLSTDPNDIEW